MPSHHPRRTPALKTELDMNDFFDFSQAGPSPTTAAGSAANLRQQSAAAAAAAAASHDWSPFDQSDDQSQQFNGPSHDYNQYKQQVGLPIGSMANGAFDGYGSGFDAGLAGYGSGIDLDGDMGMDFAQPQQQAMFFPSSSSSRQQSQSDSFVNPTTIGGQEEPPSNVGRLWPGMHSQQAAMQKQQIMMQNQQRHMQMRGHQHQPQQQPQRRQSAAGPSSLPQQKPAAAPANGNGNGKRPSHTPHDPAVEERISRLLNEMRQATHASNASDDGDSPGGLMPHIARMRKDEDDMDEDERLLASEEGKKLSSKERRQLRNKVSARAFRSRRKEYISQLEGEVAVKAQEAQSLRVENANLVSENDAYRNLISTMLGHPSFKPFLDEISKNPAAFAALPIAMPAPVNGMQMQQATPVSANPQSTQSVEGSQTVSESSQTEQTSNQNEQQQKQQQQQQQQQQRHQQHQHHVNMATIPEENFSKLNINGGFGGQTMNFNQFQSVNAYPVTAIDVPDYDPADLLADSPIYSSVAASPNLDTTVLIARLDRAAGRMR